MTNLKNWQVFKEKDSVVPSVKKLGNNDPKKVEDPVDYFF